MNILIIGKPSANLIALIKKSKYTDKIYTAINGDNAELPNIEYRNYNELIQKALALKIDIAINTDKIAAAQGIAEIFKKSKVNLISVNKKWLNLETSRLSAKKLLMHYNINVPQAIRTPMAFPIVVKTDSPGKDYTVNNMQELVQKMEELEGLSTFFEEPVSGMDFSLYMICDRKNIRYFYSEKNLTEVQKDRLDLLKIKLNFMFSDENVDFTGIFGVNLIWYKNDWYVVDFDMGAEIPEDILEGSDFIYILDLAIYQKLGDAE